MLKLDLQKWDHNEVLGKYIKTNLKPFLKNS